MTVAITSVAIPAAVLQVKSSDYIIKLAIMAVGGQGGGVLTNWIESLARSQGYACQATSVAGVSQRTGATIYYIEMAPGGTATPVFSLSPSAGDVDILIAAEMMEAGRAILRGFVTPDRTTLIASTHRALAVAEKSVPGDGIASSEEVRAAAQGAAKRLIMADLEHAAVQVGSVISASLFGALAASKALPFDRSAFESAISADGASVERSLRAFDNGFDAASEPSLQRATAESLHDEPGVVTGPAAQLDAWQQLVDRVHALPCPVADMTLSGLVKVVDFQNSAYGASYLQSVEAVVARDDKLHDYRVSIEAAKYIANAMAYDDIIRVADLKTRASRFARIRGEMDCTDSQLMQITEFMHPRAEELVGMLPASLGRWMEASPKRMALIARLFFRKGRRLRSDRMGAFTLLYVVGGLRGWRLKTHRHSLESAHIEQWLDTALSHLPDRYEMAVEILKCRRLIKGYSDTHSRGLSKFDRVMQAAMQVAHQQDGAILVARLREAALQDEEGKALDAALQSIASLQKID